MSSLPSPQRIASSTPQMVVVTTTKVELGPQQQVALREVFPSSASPSSCSPLSETPSNSFGRTSTKEQVRCDKISKNSTLRKCVKNKLKTFLKLRMMTLWMMKSLHETALPLTDYCWKPKRTWYVFGTFNFCFDKYSLLESHSFLG